MLSISNVETFYGNIQALRGVNVKVNSGEIVSLIGSNGAGKSTLLMTISGVNKAATGKIKFDDKNIESLPPHDIVNLGISQVPEGRRIFSRLSVEDNLRLGASSNDKGKNFATVFTPYLFGDFILPSMNMFMDKFGGKKNENAESKERLRLLNEKYHDLLESRKQQSKILMQRRQE